MKHKKSSIVILSFLLLATLVQTIVILDYYLDDVALGFFPTQPEAQVFFRSYEEVVRDTYLTPFRMFVNADEIHTFEITRKEGNFHDLFWRNARDILRQAWKQNADEQLGAEQWYNLCILRGISLRFSGVFPASFFAWMTGADHIPPGLTEASGILLAVKENDWVDVYVKTPGGIAVYRDIPAQGLFLTGNFDNFSEFLKTDVSFTQNRYAYTRMIFGAHRLRVEPDIPVILHTFDQQEGIRNLEWVRIRPVPILGEYAALTQSAERLPIQDRLITQKASEIQNLLFGRLSDRYRKVIHPGGSLYFTNQYHIFEITPYHRASFRYSPGYEGMDKGTLEQAFMNALNTVNIFFGLYEGQPPGLYLADISETGNYYEFAFNYLFENRPVLFRDTLHAVTVRATATRTIDAQMLLLDISGQTGIALDYDVDFIRLIQKNQIDMLTLASADMFLGYEIGDNFDSFLSPVWFNLHHDGTRSAWPLAEVTP